MSSTSFNSYQQLNAFLALFRAHCSPALYQQIHQGHSAHFCLALFSFLSEHHIPSTLSVLARQSTHLPSDTIEQHPYSHSFVHLFDHYFDIMGSEAPERWASQWPLDTYWKNEFIIKEYPNPLDFIQLIEYVDQSVLEHIRTTLAFTYDQVWMSNLQFREH